MSEAADTLRKNWLASLAHERRASPHTLRAYGDDVARFIGFQAGHAVRQRFQRFFEIAPIGIALVEADGRFTETNQALEALLTDGQDKLAGREIFEFVDDSARTEVQARLAAVWAGHDLRNLLR